MAWLIRIQIALLTVVATMMSPAFSSAQQNTPRVIRLISQVDPANDPLHLFADASGTLILSTAGSEFIFGELSVKKMTCLSGDPKREGGFFGVYMHTPTTGTKPIVTFNTACTPRSMHIDFPMPPGTWLTEPLTVYVFNEGDDGVDAFTAGNTLILSGSD